MKRVILILIAFVIGLSASASILAQQNPQPAASKPNVVLIIMDDMGYGDLGSYGVAGKTSAQVAITMDLTA